MDGFDAIASYLYQSVEDDYLGEEFCFGSTLIGPDQYISDCREREAMREFACHHDESEMMDYINDALGECLARDFIADGEKCLFGYLLSLASFREKATSRYRKYRADIDAGKIADALADEYRDRIYGVV